MLEAILIILEMLFVILAFTAILIGSHDKATLFYAMAAYTHLQRKDL